MVICRRGAEIRAFESRPRRQMHWRNLGVEELLASRGFAVGSVEVDRAWGQHECAAPPRRGEATPGAWCTSAADDFLWLARSHGYDGFIKVPCARARSFASRYDGAASAWYLPLARGDAGARRPPASSGGVPG